MLPHRPDPVKLFAAVLHREPDALHAALDLLAKRIGEIDFEGADHPFGGTDYYDAEMGPGLLRRIVSFEELIAPEAIVGVKLAAVEIEEALRAPGGGRRINIDPGYLDVHKAVLASAKYGAPKVHVGEGVYADLVLRYSKGRFHPFEWTFADFRSGTYDADLLEVRRLYKLALRAGA